MRDQKYLKTYSNDVLRIFTFWYNPRIYIYHFFRKIIIIFRRLRCVFTKKSNTAILDISISNLTVYKNPYIAGDMYYNQCVDRGDGILSVAIVDVESRMKLLGLIPSLYNGNALDKEGTRYFECEWLELQTNHDVVIETDGEIVGHPPARYTIMKHAIRTVIG